MPKQSTASALPGCRQEPRTEQRVNGGRRLRQRGFGKPRENVSHTVVSEADLLSAECIKINHVCDRLSFAQLARCAAAIFLFTTAVMVRFFSDIAPSVVMPLRSLRSALLRSSSFSLINVARFSFWGVRSLMFISPLHQPIGSKASIIQRLESYEFSIELHRKISTAQENQYCHQNNTYR